MYVGSPMYMYILLHMNSRVGSKHNREVTERFVKDVVNAGDFTNRRDIECMFKRDSM